MQPDAIDPTMLQHRLPHISIFSTLDVQLGLPPVTTFGIPPTLARPFVTNSLDRIARSTLAYSRIGGYRNRIHCGTGRFCRAAFASLTLVLKDLWDGIATTLIGKLVDEESIVGELGLMVK